MKLVMFFSALLVPGIALGSLLPSAVPGSEMAGGMGSRLVRRGCTANNCARAVTGTNARAPLTVRQSDCSSFMQQSVVLPTTTITETVNNQRRQQTVVPSNIPTYASACDNVSKYSSACSCWGITATTVTVRPTVTSTVTTLTGILQVNAGGSSLGYVATDPNYWTPLLTSDATSALVVAFEVPVGATSATSVGFMASPNEGYPFLGLVQGRDNTDSTEEPGSFKGQYLANGNLQAAPGSTPQVVGGFFDASSGGSYASESSVWNIDIGTGAVTPTWINPDGGPASNMQIFIQSNHVYAGSDPAAFHSRFPAPVTVATLTFIPS